MIKKLFKLTKTTLFRGSLIILLSTTIGNFFNYLYHFATGRMLSPAEYGLLQSFISLTYFQSILVSSFSNSVIEKIGSTESKNLQGTIKCLEKLSIKLSLIFWLITLIFYPLVKRLLHLDSFGLFLIFSFQALLAFLPSVYGSTLIARLKFVPGAIVSVISTFIKLISAVILLHLSLGVIGGLSSWIIWRMVSILLGGFFVYRYWIKQKKVQLPKIGSDFFKFSILSLMVNFFLTSLYSTDIILSRFYLGNRSAGLYAATSNLGKIIFFGASTVMTVAFPLFVKYRNRLVKLRTVFGLAFVFCLIISIGGVVTFHFFPELLIWLLYGNKYLQAGQYLGGFSIFILFLAIFDLLSKFLLALRSKFAAIIPGVAAITQIILIIFNHQNINAIIANSLIAVGVGVIFQLFIVLKLANEFNRPKNLRHRPGV